MPEELGKVEKLEADRFKKGRKLYFVPLVYSGQEAPDEYKEKCSRYWQQVEEHLAKLASMIGQVNRVYHESVLESGDEGMKAIERLNPSSYQIAKRQCDNGAVLVAIEERELFEEAMDWQRCLMLGFLSDKVASKVTEFYAQAARRRNEFMAKKISETLKDDEAGLLFIREEHSVQFPSDIEVFSIFPPALDEIRRWYRDKAMSAIQKGAEQNRDSTGVENGKAVEGTNDETEERDKK